MIYEYTATDYKFATPFNFILLGTFYIALHILQETNYYTNFQDASCSVCGRYMLE